MSQFPKDDRELISFLQQYRPSPPPGDSSLEKQIYLKISRESQKSKTDSIRWFISGTIVTTLLGIWGLSNIIKPSDYQKFVQQSQVTQTAEIEDFMVNTWEDTMNTSSWETPNQSVYYQWISLDDLPNHYLVSHP
ncbi:MAG: hypothetical protein QNJ64_10195 [Crocosphaera sp.]|nr:hypothetical protein [Crocosphaera sp.]